MAVELQGELGEIEDAHLGRVDAGADKVLAVGCELETSAGGGEGEVLDELDATPVGGGDEEGGARG